MKFPGPVFLSLLVASVGLAHGEPTGRVEIKESEFLRSLGVVVPRTGRGYSGNGFFVDKNGCYVLSNFHVVFGLGKNKSGTVEIIDDPAPGYSVNFLYDFDTAEGKFRSRENAKVVDFGNYEAGTTRGFLGDWALLKLDKCAGKEFAGPEFTQVLPRQRIPTGMLRSISIELQTPPFRVLQEDGCRSEAGTPVTGMLASNCFVENGMSGSMILEQGADKKWRIAGMSTKHSAYKDGTGVSLAIYASVLYPAISALIPKD